MSMCCKGKLKGKTVNKFLTFLCHNPDIIHSVDSSWFTNKKKKQTPTNKDSLQAILLYFTELSNNTVTGSISKKKSCSGVDKFIFKEK